MDSPAGSCKEGNWLKTYLPKLRIDECRFTSVSTWDYNCVGFVAGDFRWWHYLECDDWYWPDDVKRAQWASSYIEALATAHFEECKETRPEYDRSMEKIAIFHQGGAFKHVALLVAPGVWMSKLGEFEDLQHPLDAMAGKGYGKPFAFLMRDVRHRPMEIPTEYPFWSAMTPPTSPFRFPRIGGR